MLAQIDFKQLETEVDIAKTGKGILDLKLSLKLGEIIDNLDNYLFVLAGLAMLLYLVWGGFEYMTSGGEPSKMEAAKGKITNALIGFIIMFSAYWIVQVVGIILDNQGIKSVFK